MGDILLALSIPVLVFAGGIYAAGESWWRRRHPAPPSPYTHQAARLAERAMLVDAERIVDGAYEAVGTLYDGPSAPGGDHAHLVRDFTATVDVPPTAPTALTVR